MSKTALYLKIKQDIKESIDHGVLQEGDRIPSELELAEKYRVSRNPTRQALRELELAGYIVRSRRRGSFVAPRAQRMRHLRLSQGRILALVCPPARSPHLKHIIEGFTEQAGEVGYNVLIYFMDSTTKSQAEVLNDLRHSGLSGVALWLMEDGDKNLDALTACRDAAFPLVLVDRFQRGFDSDFVVSDNEAIGYETTRALIARGHRTIGFFGSHYVNTATEDRHRGFMRALREAKLDRPQELSAALSPRDDSRAYAIHRVVAHKSRPTAFFCAEAWIAILAANELRRLGYAMPGDVELASVDDGELPPNSGVTDIRVQQRSVEMGRAAVATLIRRIEEPHASLRRTYLKPEFSLKSK